MQVWATVSKHLSYHFNESSILQLINGVSNDLQKLLNPHMYEIFLQRYCMKWVPGDTLKEMINQTSILVYYLTRKTLMCSSLVQKVCMFFQKKTSHCRNSLALVPRGHKHYIFGSQFYSKNASKLKFHVFLYFQVRNHMIS